MPALNDCVAGFDPHAVVPAPASGHDIIIIPLDAVPQPDPEPEPGPEPDAAPEPAPAPAPEAAPVCAPDPDPEPDPEPDAIPDPPTPEPEPDDSPDDALLPAPELCAPAASPWSPGSAGWVDDALHAPMKRAVAAGRTLRRRARSRPPGNARCFSIRATPGSSWSAGCPTCRTCKIRNRSSPYS